MSGLMSLDKAVRTLLESLSKLEETESVPLIDCVGRVLTEDLIAPINVPPHTNSAMDGYALRSSDLEPAPTMLNISQRIIAGSLGTELLKGEAARIFTGAPLPDGADCVAMQENCIVNGEKVEVLDKLNYGDNLRFAGEDIKIGSTLLESGVRLAPQDIGLAASVGLARLSVKRRLRVALISTGNELIQPGEQLLPGQIYNSNLYSLSALLKGMSCEIVYSGIVRDDFEETKKLLLETALEADCIITTGGVSVGEEDHVKAAIEANGYLDLWKLAIKPGKPFASGKIKGTQVFGLPGNPVSAFVTFLLLVKPCLLSILGCNDGQAQGQAVKAHFSVGSASDRQEYLRVSLQLDDRGIASMTPYQNQSSGVGASLAKADGFAVVPPHTKVSQGDYLEFISFAELLR